MPTYHDKMTLGTDSFSPHRQLWRSQSCRLARWMSVPTDEPSTSPFSTPRALLRRRKMPGAWSLQTNQHNALQLISRCRLDVSTSVCPLTEAASKRLDHWNHSRFEGNGMETANANNELTLSTTRRSHLKRVLDIWRVNSISCHPMDNRSGDKR